MSPTRLLAFVVLLVVAIGRAHAADGPMAITGVVVDAQDLALPGVTVTLKAASGDVTEQVTDERGHFAFRELTAGAYTIVVSLSGFETKVFGAVTVPGSPGLKAVLQLAGVTETVVVRPESPAALLLSAPTGEAVMERKTLGDVPLATNRFEDALPLLPGIVRGPDGLLNMNGARADQSAYLLNGVSMTDPVTGHFAARLPIEAIESVDVHAGVFSTAFGNATGGVTNVVTRPGQDTFDVQVQNFMPRLRFYEGGVHGVSAFTPRVRVSGPIRRGRLWFSQAISYRYVQSRVDELGDLDVSMQKVKSLDSVTQVDWAINQGHRLTAMLVVFPSNVDNAGIDTLHPIDATPDMRQRGWTAAIAERAVLDDTVTLSVAGSIKQYDLNVAPKHDDAALLTVSGYRDNYFNRFDRDSRRYDGSATLAVATPDRWGQHLTRAGGEVARSTYEGIDESRPVAILGARGSPVRRIDYMGGPSVGAGNTEVAWFIDDQWVVHPRVAINGGLRYAYEQIAGQHTLAPRLDASVRPFGHGHTVIKGGIGRFHDKLPLNAADLTRQQARRVTDYDAGGRISAVSILSNRVDPDGLRTPASTAWNLEVDQVVATDLLARVRYRQARGFNQLIVDPIAGDGTLLLSSRGRSRSNEIEVTLRRQFEASGHVTASYVRSSTKGDLNDFVSLFGDLRDPVIQPNEFGPQPFDAPHRVLFWGVLSVPRDITVAPTLEYRTGFPYSIVDEQRNIVGARNQGGRYPNLFTLDMAVTKDLQLTKAHRARVGVQLFNLTNHFNPRDVQNNTASPAFRQFANSVDVQVRAKFTLLF